MVVYKQDVDNGPSGFVWVVTCLGFGELKKFVLFLLKKGKSDLGVFDNKFKILF